MKQTKYIIILITINIVFQSCDQSNFTDAKDQESGTRKYNEVYKGKDLNRIAFPIGGIGAGMFCLEGTGAFSHVSVRNSMDVFNEPLMFAALAVKGLKDGAKVLEGPVPEWKYFGRPNAARGGGHTSYGLPRFENAEFLCRFPFAYIILSDKDIPLEVRLTGWSPFIPTDPDNSSLPVGAVEYSFINRGDKMIDAVFSFHSVNFMSQKEGINAILPVKNGFVLSQMKADKAAQLKGDFVVFTDQLSTVTDHCWFRGGWNDPLTMVWENVEQANLKSNPPIEKDAPGASLFVPIKVAPGGETTIHLMFSWYVPDSDIRTGKDPYDAPKCDPSTGCCISPYYQPWYSGKFSNIREVTNYWKIHYPDLKSKSRLFSDAFYASSLPAEVLEAIAANLTILKSPTVMRQRDGKIWAWEGCNDNSGCCAGSCTHVWNYAQALCHMFPSLERTLRETEFNESQNKEGHQTFRSALPIRPVDHQFYAASDGQLGGIMKIYRDWKISGNNTWMKKLFPKIKSSMDYCIETWDPRHKGVIEEPHHNTYDIEFWGSDGMITSIYLGALNAICEMGKFISEDVILYQQLYQNGKQFMENILFNGEYFIQKIQWTDLNAPDPVEASKKSIGGNYSNEAIAVLQREGPKYQYGDGCLSDGVLGCWMARVCGLPDPIDANKIKSHVLSVYKNNLKNDLSDHPNPQRSTYALGHEGGLLLCTWPKGEKPSLPFVYSDEVWTGIEYQVASHLMFMGEIEKGLEIVRICRNRYDGSIRNPFDEYECGHWYARAMASYALLEGMTGVRFDAVDKILYIDSRIGDFTSFLSAETGFGNVGLKNNKPFIKMAYGNLDIKKVLVSGVESELVK